VGFSDFIPTRTAAFVIDQQLNRPPSLQFDLWERCVASTINHQEIALSQTWPENAESVQICVVMVATKLEI